MKLLTNYIPRLARIGSGGSLLKCLMLLLRFYYFVITRKLGVVSRSQNFPITFTFNKVELSYYLQHPMDLQVLVEIFVYKEYEWDLGEFKPKYIFDLGAHFGDTTLYYSAVYPNATIVAVEPDPENFARLLLHTKRNKNIIPLNVAVGPMDKEIPFYKGKSSIGFSVERRSVDDVEISVPQKSVATILEENNIPSIDLFKFDIEGAEFSLLESLDLTKVATVYIGELHFDLSNTYTLAAFQAGLVNQSYIFKIDAIPGHGRHMLKLKNT